MKFVFCAIVALALSRCSNHGDRTELTKADHGRVLHLRQGTELTVSLEGNPTTGFTWEVAELDSAAIVQEKEAEFVPHSRLIGAPGTFTFHFRALKKGTATLRLVYRRPWEKEVPADTFSVRVVIK
ncbi:MAG: protease inhibitor I42 family protein [candidate division KSB1 bacterium]|nr:protease inhibitor I42 family protein [candidate division KSB1 bacterium]